MMANEVDLVVLGAGPAGINAAVAASEQGLSVVLVDQNHGAGGQVFRPVPDQFRRKAGRVPSPELQLGDEQRKKLQQSKVKTYFNHTVWGVGSGFRVDAVGPDGPVHWNCRALIAAGGTTERVVPFPGWTLPRVIGLAAATIMLKSQNMLPGKNTLVAGCGPLLAAVGAGIIKGGGTVAALVDSSPKSAWLKATPALLSRPDLMWQGVKWLKQIKASGTPVMSAQAIEKVEQEGDLLRVTILAVDAQRRLIADSSKKTLFVDTIVVGNGLVPGTDITRLLRAQHEYVNELGGWVATTDDYCRTSIANLYAAGDGCGISGAAAAIHHGELAGLTAARDLGRLDQSGFSALADVVQRRLAKAKGFGRAMGALMAMPIQQAETISSETIVCRCEDVSRQEIDAAVAGGARDMNQVKAWTRCGMGPCQGRTCGDVAASLVALQVGSREAAGYFTGRAPLRPVSLEQLTGDYEYSDIPLPKAAPL